VTPRRVNVGWLVAAAALLVAAFVAFGASSSRCTPHAPGPPTCGSQAPGVVAVLALAGSGYCLYRALRRRD
jgi:hypothetical protein